MRDKRAKRNFESKRDSAQSFSRSFEISQRFDGKLNVWRKRFLNWHYDENDKPLDYDLPHWEIVGVFDNHKQAAEFIQNDSN